MASIIRDAALAAKGAQKIEWARRHMAVLNSIAEEFEKITLFIQFQRHLRLGDIISRNSNASIFQP